MPHRKAGSLSTWQPHYPLQIGQHTLSSPSLFLFSLRSSWGQARCRACCAGRTRRRPCAGPTHRPQRAGRPTRGRQLPCRLRCHRDGRATRSGTHGWVATHGGGWPPAAATAAASGSRQWPCPWWPRGSGPHRRSPRPGPGPPALAMLLPLRLLATSRFRSGSKNFVKFLNLFY